jgi:homoserine O-acetyltransferase/O-succinyltransferase
LFCCSALARCHTPVRITASFGADLIGPDGILDPTRWFIIIPNMFSNGVSSGAGNTADYPALVTSLDNVTAQRRLLTEQFDIKRLHAAYGFSMGGQQAYHWAAMFPDAVDRAIVVCSSAKTRRISRWARFVRGKNSKKRPAVF